MSAFTHQDLIKITTIQLAHLTVVAGRAHPSELELTQISDFVSGSNEWMAAGASTLLKRPLVATS
jgi:hypothetical protein